MRFTRKLLGLFFILIFCFFAFTGIAFAESETSNGTLQTIGLIAVALLLCGIVGWVSKKSRDGDILDYVSRIKAYQKASKSLVDGLDILFFSVKGSPIKELFNSCVGINEDERAHFLSSWRDITSHLEKFHAEYEKAISGKRVDECTIEELQGQLLVWVNLMSRFFGTRALMLSGDDLWTHLRLMNGLEKQHIPSIIVTRINQTVPPLDKWRRLGWRPIDLGRYGLGCDEVDGIFPLFQTFKASIVNLRSFNRSTSNDISKLYARIELFESNAPKIPGFDDREWFMRLLDQRNLVSSLVDDDQWVQARDDVNRINEYLDEINNFISSFWEKHAEYLRHLDVICVMNSFGLKEFSNKSDETALDSQGQVIFEGTNKALMEFDISLAEKELQKVMDKIAIERNVSVELIKTHMRNAKILGQLTQQHLDMQRQLVFASRASFVLYDVADNDLSDLLKRFQAVKGQFIESIPNKELNMSEDIFPLLVEIGTLRNANHMIGKQDFHAIGAEIRDLSQVMKKMQGVFEEVIRKEKAIKSS